MGLLLALHLEITPDSDRGSCEMPETESEPATCKASALQTGLLLFQLLPRVLSV